MPPLSEAQGTVPTGDNDRSRLNALAARAQDGDAEALTALVEAIADDVYHLALRMLWHPHDAEDASQEALLRIITRLGSFRGDASFRTWSYRVAVNHYLNVKQSRVERERLTFDTFAQQLLDGLEADPGDRPDSRILAQEVKLGCTLGMLLCLDREQRIAYILGDVFELTSTDAAYVAGTSAQTYRKRLSRARSRLRAFVGAHCGLVSSDAACRCDKRVTAAVRTGRVDPDHLMFTRRDDIDSAMDEMERLHDAASLMRSHPEYAAPVSVKKRIRSVLGGGPLTSTS